MHAAPLGIALLFAFCTSAEEPIRILERPYMWERQGGTEESFEFNEGQLSTNWTWNGPAALLTRQDYENFTLHFEFNLAAGCEGGLYLHVPRNGAYQAGIEIELVQDYDKPATTYSSGSIFGRVAPREPAINDKNEWNSCDVFMDWPRLKVVINEQVVQDVDLFTHDDLRYTLRRGAIGFQYVTGGAMQVRDCILTPLPDTEKGRPLIRQNDLQGWTEERDGCKWEVDGGVLKSLEIEHTGYLKHEVVCQDFDLRFYVKTSPMANGGVFFRWIKQPDDRGNEIQILDLPGTRMPTGSIYNVARGDDRFLTPGEWELVQVFVRHNHAITFVNGSKCAETHDLTAIRPGHIVLQMHRRDASIEWKEMVLVVRD